MRFVLLFICIILHSGYAKALDVEVDGIFYSLNTNSKTARTTYSGNKNYSGDIRIPEEITYNGVTYRVTGIGNFANCTELTSISIPRTIENIYDHAFLGCTGLVKVIVPDIKAWCGIHFDSGDGTNPLYYAQHLYSDEDTEITELIIPNDVEVINDYAFRGFSGLTSIVIPEGVATIGKSAFRGCGNLISVSLPKKTELRIGDWAFKDCSSLQSITLPDRINMGTYAFENCTSLISADSLSRINYSAFKGCTNLQSVSFRAVSPSISKGAFSDCFNLRKVVIEDMALWAKGFFDGLEAQPLYYAHQLYVDYPDGEKRIEKLNVPTSLSDINQYAFAGCSSITSLDFTGCDYLRRIGAYAFYECNNLRSVDLRGTFWDGYSGRVSIGERAFARCTNLWQVNTYNMSAIGVAAFQDCINLTDVGESWDVLQVEGAAFSGCISLRHVPFFPRVERIYNLTFANCTNIDKIVIPANIISIASDAFQGCNLTSIVVDENNPYLDSRNNCNALITTENNTLVFGCKNSFIPNGITSIADRAFCDCTGMTSIVLPASIETIGKDVFSSCTALQDIYCYAETVPNCDIDISSPDIFNPNTKKRGTLHVPLCAIDDYYNRTPWLDFYNIIPLADTDPNPSSLTDINTPIVKNAEKEGFYDLNGRYTERLNRKGIYIHGGRKIILK